MENYLTNKGEWPASIVSEKKLNLQDVLNPPQDAAAAGGDVNAKDGRYENSALSFRATVGDRAAIDVKVRFIPSEKSENKYQLQVTHVEHSDIWGLICGLI